MSHRLQKTAPTAPTKTNPATQKNRRSILIRSRIAFTVFGAVLCLARVFAVGHLALSQQQQQAQSFDFDARRQQILAHLNAVIQFYRSATTPVQKIGEPNDIVYRDQAVTLATQATQLAFQSAHAEADLMAQYQSHDGSPQQNATPAAQQRLQSAAANVEQNLNTLKARADALDKKLASASAKQQPSLQAQRKQVQAAIDLGEAMKDALGKIVGMSDTQGSTGFSGTVDSLQRSIPQLGSKTASVAAQLEAIDQARSAGVSSQTVALFSLLGTEHEIDTLIRSNDDLNKQTQALRAPLTDIVRKLATQGQQLSQQATGASTEPAAKANAQSSKANEQSSEASAQSADASADALESITTTFKEVSSASVPLTQEVVVQEQSQANLQAWHDAVDRECKSILRTLLLRLMVIAIALGLIFMAGELATRATNKYIRDERRRRQLLRMRRAVVGFLSLLVLLFGFVTQFNSLATFAGFITAGIAVGLQTILLSVAAYFFIIGRYGIKTGDRITVTPSTGPAVTGEVIEVGLVRFYMMELAGKGIELHPTGRVVVFANAILFSAGSPLYKQLPGTEYAWHELLVNLAEKADYKPACDAILNVVRSVYDEYRAGIESQYGSLTQKTETPISLPGIESRLQFDSATLQFWVRFPVQIRNAAATDEQMTKALLQLFTEDAVVKEAVTSLPVLQPSVKG